MKKRNSVWVALMLALGLSGAASAAPTALLPTQIAVSPDSQVRVAFSNSEPNLLVVPGDRIVSIESAQGMLIGGNQKGVEGHLGGSVVLMTTQTKPFTFYVRTAGGLTVSVVAVPEKRDGRVLQLVSNQPAKSPTAKRWEQSLPYPRLLTHIHKALLNGEPPEGFLAAPVTPLPTLPLPVGLRYQADQMWNGGELRVYKLSVTNTTARSLTMTERLFHGAGVRSVLVFPYSETVLPGATATVWLTVSNEVGHG